MVLFHLINMDFCQLLLTITLITVTKINGDLNPNPYNLTFVINEPETCADKPDVFIILTVSTAPDHFKHRSTIRRTWGRNFSYDRIKLVTLFFVGLTEDRDVMDAIKFESETFHDVIQTDFVDAYRNMTYKFVAELQWVHRHCSTAKFMLKTDDDAFVDIFRLNEYLKVRLHTNRLMCRVWSHGWPKRDPRHKWHVTKEEYAGDTYPRFCNGQGVILPTSLTGPILDAVSKTKFFWIDDLFITGVIADQLGIGHMNLDWWFPPRLYELENMVNDVTRGRMILLHAENAKALIVVPFLWKMLTCNDSSVVVKNNKHWL